MKKAELSNRFINILVTLGCSANIMFADIPRPSPKMIPDEPAAYDWGFIIGSSLFAFAGALVIVWIARKFSQRSSK